MGIPYNCYLLSKDGKPTTDLTTGDLYISVSTVLKAEGKDLIPWALRTFGPDEDPMKAYNSFMERVSDLGSRIHLYIEYDLKQTPLDASQIREDMLPAIEAYHTWKNENEVEMIASEQIVFHPKWRIAGTTDLVVRINGKLFVADIKTGSVQSSAYSQMAVYLACLRNVKGKKRIQDIDNADIAVINVHREGKPVEVHTRESFYDGKISINDELGVFHALRFVWFMRNIKSRKWAAVIKNMAEVMSPLEAAFKTAFQI